MWRVEVRDHVVEQVLILNSGQNLWVGGGVDKWSNDRWGGGVRKLLQLFEEHSKNFWYLQWGTRIHSGSRRRGGGLFSVEVHLALLIVNPSPHILLQSCVFPLSSVSSPASPESPAKRTSVGQIVTSALSYSLVWYPGLWSGKRCSVGPAELSCDCLLIRRELGRSSAPPMLVPPASISRSLWFRRHVCASLHRNPPGFYFSLNILWYKNPGSVRATRILRVFSPPKSIHFPASC